MIEQALPGDFPLPVLGKMQDQSAGPTGDPGGNGHQPPPDRRGGGPGKPGTSDCPYSTGKVEGHDRAHQPGAVGGERR